MVISTFHEDWQERLARLRRCIADRPDGPVWLWSMRIRILEFIASRHGRSPSPREPAAACDARRAETPDVMDSLSEDTHGPALPWHLLPTVGPARAECPPRSRDSLNPALASLQHVNDANRMRLDRGAHAQDVWLWWREEWCCRKIEAAYASDFRRLRVGLVGNHFAFA